MSVRPASAAPLPTPSEMALLAAEAGLTLNAGQMADLALAWRQLVGLVARMPRDRPLLDDQAYVFRLPPPGSAAGAPAAGRPAPAWAAAKPKSGATSKALAPTKSGAKPAVKPGAKTGAAAVARRTNRRV